MATTDTASAVDHYAARIAAVLAQRTRLRGPQPPGDLFAGLPPGHPLLSVDPRQRLGENLERPLSRDRERCRWRASKFQS